MFNTWNKAQLCSPQKFLMKPSCPCTIIKAGSSGHHITVETAAQTSTPASQIWACSASPVLFTLHHVFKRWTSPSLPHRVEILRRRLALNCTFLLRGSALISCILGKSFHPQVTFHVSIIQQKIECEGSLDSWGQLCHHHSALRLTGPYRHGQDALPAQVKWTARLVRATNAKAKSCSTRCQIRN